METIKRHFDYRIYWMGFAMLWIMFFHSGIQWGGILGTIKKTGYGGVDIFMFASGIGNYFSYQKYATPLDFLKRKIGRLAPSYLPFMAVWLAYQGLCGQNLLRISLGNLLGLQGFCNYGGQFNWYVSGILLCYILTPYFAEFVKKEGFAKNLILLAVLTLASFAFWEDTQLIICVTRLPIFLMGMICAKYGDKPMKSSYTVLSIAACIAGFALLLSLWKKGNTILWNYGLYWYPFLLITPGLCIAISGFVRLLQSRDSIKKIFSPMLSLIRLCGECSFEIFLIHIFVFDIAKKLISRYNISHISLTYFSVALLSIALAALYHRVIGKVSELKNKES